MALAIVSLLCGYLLGSLPSAYIIARLRRGTDIRTIGTGNVGALNTLQEVGTAESAIVLVIDVAKGIVAILIARALGVDEVIQLSAAGAAVLGHMFPLFLKFSGGKGGATILGIFLFLMPLGTPFYLTAYLLMLVITRNISFSYRRALICFPFVGWLSYDSVLLIFFSVALLILLETNYISGIKPALRQGIRQTIMRPKLTRKQVLFSGIAISMIIVLSYGIVPLIG